LNDIIFLLALQKGHKNGLKREKWNEFLNNQNINEKSIGIAQLKWFKSYRET
jgi:hypothetical protein